MAIGSDSHYRIVSLTQETLARRRVALPVLGYLVHNVLVLVCLFEVIREFVVHHAAGNQAIAIKVLERFIFGEIPADLGRSESARRWVGVKAPAFCSLLDWRGRV